MERKLGKINISAEVISIIAGVAAVESYGIVGMTKRSLREGIVELLGRDNFSKGIDIKFQENEVIIDLYVVVRYGTNIGQVAQNVMEKVKYSVEKVTGLVVRTVNVNIQGVKINGN